MRESYNLRSWTSETQGESHQVVDTVHQLDTALISSTVSFPSLMSTPSAWWNNLLSIICLISVWNLPVCLFSPALFNPLLLFLSVIGLGTRGLGGVVALAVGNDPFSKRVKTPRTVFVTCPIFQIVIFDNGNDSNIIKSFRSLNFSTSSTPFYRVGHAFKTDTHHQEEAEWLWPLDDTQMMFVEGHEAGTRFTCPTMTLNSAAPLRVEDVEEALFHLQRLGLLVSVVLMFSITIFANAHMLVILFFHYQ